MGTQTGAYIALAGIIVQIAQALGWVVDQNSIVTIISSIAIIYGWAHQWYVTRRLKNLAIEAGVKGLR